MDNLPIGTILTVPDTTNLEDYQGWRKFTDLSLFEPVSVGEIKLGFDNNQFPTKSWKEWSRIRKLSKYPELKNFIFYLIQTFELNSKTRDIWEKAYRVDTLPDIKDLFIAIDYKQAGYFVDGSVGTILHTPMVEHTDNVLKPMGLSPTEEAKPLYSPVSSKDIETTDIPSAMLLLAQKASLHNLKDCPNLVKTGQDCVGYPNHITMNVYINTKTYYPHIPDGYMLIIKEK